jgi:hypothetical protein
MQLAAAAAAVKSQKKTAAAGWTLALAAILMDLGAPPAWGCQTQTLTIYKLAVVSYFQNVPITVIIREYLATLFVRAIERKTSRVRVNFSFFPPSAYKPDHSGAVYSNLPQAFCVYAASLAPRRVASMCVSVSWEQGS